MKKWHLEYQVVTQTYVPSYLCNSVDGSDISDKSDSSDKNVIRNKLSQKIGFSQEKNFTKKFHNFFLRQICLGSVKIWPLAYQMDQTTFVTKKLFLTKKFNNNFFLLSQKQKLNHSPKKLKNYKLWQNSKNKIVKKSNLDNLKKIKFWQNSKSQIVTVLKWLKYFFF